MKKIIKYAGVLMLAVLAFGCKKESNDKESPSQEPFTIEVTLPEDTAETDEVYIIGEFNGEQEYALGNPQWKLTGSALSRSIILDPATFIGGKTLDDGWWFESPTRGREVDEEGDPLIRIGAWEKNTVTAWEKEAGPSFDPSGTWTVVGTINDWNQKSGIAMEVDGTARIARGVTLTAKDEFKFVMDASWDSNFGAGEPNTTFAATVGEEFELQPNGGNIQAPAGTYDIYLFPYEAKAKMVKAGDVPPAEKPVTGVSVSPTSLDLTVGESESLTLTITPTDADVKSIEWTSSDSAVAAVTPEGVVSAVAEGTATVTVTVDGLTATCNVTVSEVEQPGEGPTVYVFNATGWLYVWLYAWADGVGDIETAWPGRFPDNDVAQVGEYSYYKYTLTSDWSAGEINLIFNSGDNSGQTADFTITMEDGMPYYFYVDSGKARLIPDPYDFNPADYIDDPGPNPGDEITPGDDPTSAWSVIGHLMDTNWDKDLVMTQTDLGVWEVDITYSEGDEFKLRYYGAWDSQAGMWKDDPNESMNIEYDYGLCGDPDQNRNIKLNATGKMRLKFTPENYKFYVTKLD